VVDFARKSFGDIQGGVIYLIYKADRWNRFNIEGAHSNYVTDTTVCWLQSLFCIYDDLLYFVWNEW